MATNTRLIDVPPEDVWAVLADGWLYPLWVVGATRMRDVDDGWPGVGTRIHHSVGVWPLVTDDHTEVLDSEPGRRLELRARAWPLGEAKVSIELTPKDSGTLVTVEERVSRGPGRLLPGPAQDPMLKVRNVESLRRLSFLATGRSGR